MVTAEHDYQRANSLNFIHVVFAAATAAAAAMTVQQHEDRRRMVWWLQPEHLLTLQLRDINITKRQKPVTQ